MHQEKFSKLKSTQIFDIPGKNMKICWKIERKKQKMGIWPKKQAFLQLRWTPFGRGETRAREVRAPLNARASIVSVDIAFSSCLHRLCLSTFPLFLFIRLLRSSVFFHELLLRWKISLLLNTEVNIYTLFFKNFFSIFQNMDLPDPYLPGAISLFEQLDKKLLVVLRDGRKLIGYLRSIDQFANLILEDVVERSFVEKYFCETSQGFMLIRGENVELAGEIDDNIPTGLIQVTLSY